MTDIAIVYRQIVETIEEVPFGNSDAQNRNAIVNEERTPCRAYRHAALRIMNRLEALREAQYNLRKREIEIRMLESDRAAAKDPLKIELLDLEIEHRRSADPYTQKFIKDAVREIESLWPVIASMGKLTRAQFEAEEALHYEKKHGLKLARDHDLYAQIVGQGADGRIEAPDFAALLEQLPGGG